MPDPIDRESVAQLKTELEAVDNHPFASHKILSRVDIALLLQVINEWEHNEDALQQDYLDGDEDDPDMREVHDRIMKGNL